MKKHVKPGRKYIVIALDKPYIEKAYEILKRGQMAKAEHRPEGDITYRHWMLTTFDGVQGIDYLLKDKYMIINTDEPYAREIIKAIENYGDEAQIIEIPKKRKTGKGFKLHIKNQSGYSIDFCCGMGEYSLMPDEKITIEVNDEDYMYFDTIR